MSGAVVANATLLFDRYDLGDDCKSITLNLSSAMLDNTTFSAAGASMTTAISRIAGLKDASLDAAGYINLNSSGTDAVVFGFVGVGSTSPVVTLFPNGITEGSTQSGAGYSMQGGVAKLTYAGANVGQILPFSLTVQGAVAVAKAIALKDFTQTALSTGTTNGTVFQLGQVSTCQSLYAGLHVTALSTTLGTTISALIQSASSSGAGFTAAATTRITFSAQSCKDGTWAVPIPASGLSTDEVFWRAQFTLSTGTSTGGSANGLIWAAIQQ